MKIASHIDFIAKVILGTAFASLIVASIIIGNKLIFSIYKDSISSFGMVCLLIFINTFMASLSWLGIRGIKNQLKETSK